VADRGIFWPLAAAYNSMVLRTSGSRTAMLTWFAYFCLAISTICFANALSMPDAVDLLHQALGFVLLGLHARQLLADPTPKTTAAPTPAPMAVPIRA